MKFGEFEQSTQIITKVVLAVLLLAFLWIVRDIIVILLFSLVLASALEPLVSYFREKRIPRAVSVLAVYVLVFGFAGTVVYLLIPPVVEQFRFMQQNLPIYMESFKGALGSNLLNVVDVQALLDGIINTGDNALVSKTFGVSNGLLGFLTVLVISFYLVAEERGMKEFITTLVPGEHQDFAVKLVEKIQQKMGLWILGQVILSVSIFIFSWIGLSLLGVKYALFLALLAGLLEVIPYIGPFLSAFPAVFFAFLQSPGLAFVVIILYFLIQKTEGYVLVPKVMQKTVGISPLVVLVSLLIGFKLAGIVGILLAVPVVSAINVTVNELWPSKGSRTI